MSVFCTPSTLIAIGPSAAKPMICEPVKVRLNSALALISSRGFTITGIAAACAGPKNCPTVPRKNVRK